MTRKVEMHTDVHAPAKCKHLQDMVEHLEDWEREIDKFYLLGGSEIGGPEMCVIALKMLPPDTPPSLVMALQSNTSYDDLKDKLDKQVQFLTEFTGSHGLKINLVDDHGERPADDDDDGDGDGRD